MSHGFVCLFVYWGLRARRLQRSFSHSMFVTFIFSDLALALTFLIMTFILMQYLPYAYNSTLYEFEVFAVCLTDPRVQNVKMAFFIF